MSALTGVFANYGFALGTAGAFAIWTWPIVAAGQMLVALIFAEMAGRVPLTGSLYNWNAKLGSATLGWQAGWLTIFAYAVGGAGIIVALMSPLQSLIGIQLGQTAIYSIGVGIILVQLLISIFGVRLTAHLNRTAVAGEIFALAFFSIVLLLVLFVKKSLHLALLTTIPTSPKPYLPAFLISGLLAAYTLFGFEAASDVSEETINARYVAPQSVIWGVLFSAGLGFLFILVLTLAIPDLATIAASADPVSSIFLYYLGTIPTKLFLLFVLVAMFACALLMITNASRLTFAVARDKRVLGSSTLAKVSSYGVPANAAVFVALIEIVMFFFVYGQVAIYATSVVLLELVYLFTVCNFALGLKNLPPPQTFSLGKWRWPIIVLSVVWIFAEIAVLTIPSEFHLTAYISFGIIIAGLISQFLFAR